MGGIDALSHEFQAKHELVVRNKESFDRCLDHVRANINESVLAIAQQVETGLTLAHQCQKKMKGKVSLDMVAGLNHIKQHLGMLAGPGPA